MSSNAKKGVAGVTTPAITHAHNAKVSCEDVQAGIARNLYVFDRMSDFVIKRLAQLEGAPDAATFSQLLECLPVITQSLASIAMLRRQLLDDIAREAIDLTGRGHDGVPVSDSTPAIQRALEKMRARIDASEA